MNLPAHFHPAVRAWFERRFGAATDAQLRGWQAIAQGRDTLVAAPTGSGKTLAAFLSSIDGLFKRGLDGTLDDGVIDVVYISPLKALSSDIQRNLEAPLSEIREVAREMGYEPPEIRTALRTGDTTQAQRAAILREAPHILITTPESLYLMLTADRSRALLRNVRTVIVDELHALMRDKRGSHLALSLARLDALCERYSVNNAHRTLHGALLDAQLLAEVYLAMTRGQESLAMELEEVQAAEAKYGVDEKTRVKY